ncbi:polysaccharide pyruvyl transferase family protein [Paenibacillus nasutitermitis]|uniref:Polysaccharide pyruvyl transferase domain-containing protein n=1 Tax=Paenibacillus nasutitermitis TaxID=1652958 RepID=A0A916YXH9_9BACL|nr:polysaccharide pyruvyl transferase family protein [Paenibacillus nasutitermitis]GGD65680.1 hypothetical protein GCM10010911_24320 [Paenibacillus nasutitermitis]
MTTVLLAGVPSSPNLGDGLIARAMTYLIGMHGPHKVLHFDLTQGLSQEEDQALQQEKAQPHAYRLNDDSLKKRATPDSLRMMKAYWLHRRKNSVLSTQLKRLVAESDVVMIGGGHLFIDTYLTFPLAVRRVADEARRQGKPLHVVLVGARGPWSGPARACFRGVCRYASSIALRDEESRAFLLKFDPSLADKTVALSDPALYSQETFASLINRQEAAVQSKLPSMRSADALSAKEGGGIGVMEPPVQTSTSLKPIIGLGILDPNELRRSTSLRWERQTCAEWWQEIAAILTGKGYEVRVFTNGAESDNAFVEQMVKPLCHGLNGVSFYPYPRTVDALVDQISQCGAIIAQRLHACLPAVSMLKPTYGVIWDRKLSAIFHDLGLGGHLVDFNQPAAEAVAAMKLEQPPSALFLKTMERKKNQLIGHMGRILR